MATTNVQAFSGDVEISGDLNITGDVIATAGVDKVNLATDGTNANRSIIFSTGTSGAQPLKTDAGLTYNPSTNTLTVAGGLSTSVTPGSYLTGSAYNGSTARTFAVDATTTNTASKIVARDSSGDIFGRYLYGSYLNMSHGSANRNSDTVFYSSGDDFIRKNTASGMRSSLNVPTRTGGDASGTWDIGISGNAGSSTNVRVDRYDTGDTACFLTFTNNNTAENSKRLYMDNNLVYDNTNNRLTLNSMAIADYIYHSGDGNTYFGFNGNDSFRIVENNVVGLQLNSDSTIDIQNYIRHSGDTNTYFGFNANDQIVMRTSGADRVTVKSDGDVGIGTVSPGQKLDVNGRVIIRGAGPAISFEADNPGDLLSKRYASADRYGIGQYDGGVTRVFTSTAYAQGRVCLSGGTNDVQTGGGGFTDYVTVRNTGKVGIGTYTPTTQLHIKQGANDSTAHGIQIERSTSGAWHIYSGQYLDLVFTNSSGGYGYLQSATNVANIDFTGQHRSFIDGMPFTKYNDFEGLIVSANKNKYYNIDKKLKTGLEAIQINESLPLVSISNVEKDKACFGVISGTEDPEARKYEQGMYVTVCDKQDGDTRAFINSVGEGAIWVVNTNGNLESGDYITTSNVMGYGQKQDDDILHNYTVAKITMDCDFNPVTQPVEILKQEMGEVNYWVQETHEDVSEEEYSNLTSKNRTTKIETYYSNENGEISAETYNTFEPHVQSTYTELTRTIYQKIIKEESKTEQEGYELEVRQELVNVLDEHGQVQWEDHPTETEKAYKIRYLDADGNITDEANAVHIASFVGCTYHCG
jgi:hypothetical protein